MIAAAATVAATAAAGGAISAELGLRSPRGTPAFAVNEQVVYPLFGLGRITGVVKKTYAEPEGQLCYEVTGQHSRLWVPVAEASARGLRRLTRREDLDQFRVLLRGQPEALSQDFRQRQKDLRDRLKQGTLQSLCEVVRDLHALSQTRALVDYDAEALRKSLEALDQEWAAAERCSPAAAHAEIAGLLAQAPPA